LSRAKQVVAMLVEGMSIRAISRLTGVHKTTILSLLRTVGHKCRKLFDSRVRNIHPRYVQADEIWTFVHTKQAHLDFDAPAEWGDAYVWIALDSETKMVLSYYIGKRDPISAYAFIRDLGERTVGRFQITTDGLRSYVGPIEEYYGAEIDFAQLVKLYGKPDTDGPEWYRPSKVIATVPTPVSGNPKMAMVSTSHVERQNLSIRTSLRRFTRLSLGFSKSHRNLRAAVDLWMAYYVFCRVHQTLRVTPAMEAGIADHVWTIEELFNPSEAGSGQGQLF
jgi:IS1 family transposase